MRAMKRTLSILALASLALASVPTLAALPKGAKAPAVVTQGALAGNAYRFDLHKALEKGPVVLYFFPAAFTPGCTLEANAFAEAIPEFSKAGAQVVGMSADPIDKLKDFSRKECRDKFPVASASPATIKAFDVALKRDDTDTGLTDRTSYVIAQDGRIAMVHSDLDWREHVKLTLETVQAMKARS
jgi:peroxiredoxin